MKQILLVDDKASIGKVLSMYLGKEYDFVYCEDPLKAIDWLHEGNEPDLIISDIRMPKMTGSEFLHYLKSNELFKHIYKKKMFDYREKSVKMNCNFCKFICSSSYSYRPRTDDDS